MGNTQAYKNQYDKDNYFKVAFRIPKEKKVVLQMLSETQHKSINQLIIDAIEKYYHVDLTIVESKLIEQE